MNPVIERIILYNVRMPLVAPFETSFGRTYDRDCLIVEIQAGGLSAWGECPADRDPGYSYETTGTSFQVIRDFLAPPLLGKPAPDPETFHASTGYVKGHQMAKAALEMAFWDLQGILSGLSLQALLGGKSDRVPVGVSVGIQETTSGLVDTVQHYLRLGYRRIKLKIKPGRDVEDVTAVRQAFPQVLLQVDANSAYTLDTADHLLPLDDLDLLLIEQPLAEDDLWDHHYLQARMQTPICLDESITTPRHARQALEMDACRVINIKPARVGGLQNARLIHDLCYSQDIPVWCGGMLETGVGRAANLALASLPGFTLPGDISATDRYYYEDITYERFTLNPDSTITVPTGPGLGIQVNRAALQKFTMNSLAIGYG